MEWRRLALNRRECAVCLLMGWQERAFRMRGSQAMAFRKMELQVKAFRMTRSLVMAFHTKVFAKVEEV